jgi:hypothetical protein
MFSFRHRTPHRLTTLGLVATVWMGCELPPEQRAEPTQDVVTLLFTGSIQGEFCE